MQRLELRMLLVKRASPRVGGFEPRKGSEHGGLEGQRVVDDFGDGFRVWVV